MSVGAGRPGIGRGTDAPGQYSPVCDADHCITCGDDGIPMVVLALDPGRELALCSDGSDRSTVEIALVGPVALGDRLLVHAGTAIAHLGAA
jgi:hydrogenase maturation factor